MGLTVTGLITDFYQGESKNFDVTISLNGSNPDISSDTVTVRFKENKDDTDANSKISRAADVASQGASGIASFALAPADSANVGPRRYWVDIVWVLAGGSEYVIYNDQVNILQRISDA